MKEVTIFNKINERPEFSYSGAQISKWSGLDKSLVSRFLNEKTDISVSKFFQLIQSMPTPFQQAYWAEVLLLNSAQGNEKSWRERVSQASVSDIEEILSAIASRWAELGKDKELAAVR
jgi:hypothetical protein